MLAWPSVFGRFREAGISDTAAAAVCRAFQGPGRDLHWQCRECVEGIGATGPRQEERREIMKADIYLG